MSRDGEARLGLEGEGADQGTKDSTAPLRPVDGVRTVGLAGRSRARTGRLAALAAIVVVLALAAGAVALGFARTSTSGDVRFGAPVSVACVGQGPGAPPQSGATPRDGCPLMVVPPAGYGAATWTLDSSVPYSADATQLHLLVTEWECHGMETLDGRIVQDVQYEADAVVVTLAVRQLSGPQLCPAPPPTTYVLNLDQPVGSRSLEDGGLWPPLVIAAGGRPVVTPTPTPYPTGWREPMDCSGGVDAAGFFKLTSLTAKFDVYCAVLPAGWSMESRTGDDGQPTTLVTVTYKGPGGETLALFEGDVCSAGQSLCVPGGSGMGTAMFGDLEGKLFSGPPDADYALYVAPGLSPSWTATGKGMSLETFKALTAALIMIGKW
jgi:hypothetical protein